MPSGNPITPLRVYEGIYRGQQPEGVPDWNILRDLGIKYTLDLQTGSALLSDGSPLQEALRAEGYGIRSYAHPLGWILPPTQTELRDAVNFITYHKPCYVHCKSGVDRTGMVIAALTSSALHPETRTAAVQEMKRCGMHWWYYWWAWFL